MLPKVITDGWPAKEYRLTDEWVESPLGGRNVAYRNRQTVWYPIYRAADGNIICPTWLSVDTPPELGLSKEQM